MQTIIEWIVYDGTAKTRPHSIKVDFFDQNENQRGKIERGYCLIRKDSGKFEDMAFRFEPTFRWIGKSWRCPHCRGCGCEECNYSGEQDDQRKKFNGWEWRSRWPDYAEDNFEYPLAVGDMWAAWPVTTK